MRVERGFRSYFVRYWRYRCDQCGWLWADEKQRAHNAKVERRADMRTQRAGMGG